MSIGGSDHPALRFCVYLVPILLLAAHSFAYRYWSVDDAAITFAYARNFVEGHGLVAQPGDVPVEGFSNAAWMLLIAGIMRCGLFDLVTTPKVIGVICVAMGFGLVQHCFKKIDAAGTGAMALGVLATLPSIVIWANSGLENGLTFLLVSSLLTLAFDAHKIFNRSLAFACLAAVMAINRPDGIVYAWVYPALAIVVPAEYLPLRQKVSAVLKYVAVVGSLIAIVLLVRFRVFGEILPLTYYAKYSFSLHDVMRVALLDPFVLSRIGDVVSGIVGKNLRTWGCIVLFCLYGFGITGIGIRKECRFWIRAWTIIAITALANYLLLPPDWMGTDRFATPLILASAAVISGIMAARTFWRDEQGLYVRLAGEFFLIGVIAVTALARVNDFRARPIISIDEVRRTSQRFAGFGTLLGIKKSSLLYADVGGALWDRRVVIIDLGMLTDSVIAKTIGEGVREVNRRGFLDYIFVARQPDFIATRAWHSWRADLDSDPRFREQYVPIIEYEDQWIYRRFGARKFSGDYVRRELVENHDNLMASFRADSKGVSYPGCIGCK